jgi:hypothetical protein
MKRYICEGLLNFFLTVSLLHFLKISLFLFVPSKVLDFLTWVHPRGYKMTQHFLSLFFVVREKTGSWKTCIIFVCPLPPMLLWNQVQEGFCQKPLWAQFHALVLNRTKQDRQLSHCREPLTCHKGIYAQTCFLRFSLVRSLVALFAFPLIPASMTPACF